MAVKNLGYAAIIREGEGVVVIINKVPFAVAFEEPAYEAIVAAIQSEAPKAEIASFFI